MDNWTAPVGPPPVHRHPDAFSCLYTLVENCRLGEANLDERPADLLERLRDHPASKIAGFIAQNWVKLRESKNEGR